jgi:hypothetical protein
VVLPRLDDREDNSAAVGVGHVRVVGRAVELLDPDVALALVGRVVDVEEPARRVVGREGEPEQARLGAGTDLAGQVQEGRVLHLAVDDDPNHPLVLDDEQPVGVCGRGRHVGRRRERPDLGELDVGGRGRRRRPRQRKRRRGLACADRQPPLHPECGMTGQAAEVRVSSRGPEAQLEHRALAALEDRRSRAPDHEIVRHLTSIRDHEAHEAERHPASREREAIVERRYAHGHRPGLQARRRRC